MNFDQLFQPLQITLDGATKVTIDPSPRRTALEVDYNGIIIRVDQDVFRLHVAPDNAQVVQSRNGGAHLRHPFLPQWQRKVGADDGSERSSTFGFYPIVEQPFGQTASACDDAKEPRRAQLLRSEARSVDSGVFFNFVNGIER